MKMFRLANYTVILVLQLTTAVAFFCSEKNCRDCVSSGSCRCCRRDNECHMPIAILTNPCKEAENIFEKSHCDDESSHYDPELSMKMLLLSAAAYDPVHPQECLSNAFPSAMFQLQVVVTKKCDSDNECSGYVAVSHALKAIVVAFRGSESFDQSLKTFLETLLSPKTDFLGGEVQTYWERGFKQLWTCMEAEVKALVSKNPSYQLWVTGHSLGGAMASLASSWLSHYHIVPRRNLILYTFGMPRVGNYDYALQHDRLVNNSWRVVNDNDAVPHFPSMVSLSIVNGPYHHGVEAFYSETATTPHTEHRECHGKPYNEDLTCSFSEFLPLSFEKHKVYFSIPVGTFWKTRCVRSSRKKRETPTTDSNTNSSERFLFLEDHCTKYNYKSKSSKYIKSPLALKSSTASTLLPIYLIYPFTCCSFLIFGQYSV